MKDTPGWCQNLKRGIMPDVIQAYSLLNVCPT